MGWGRGARAGERRAGQAQGAAAGEGGHGWQGAWGGRRRRATNLALHSGEQARDGLIVDLDAHGRADRLDVGGAGRGVAAEHGEEVRCEVLHRKLRERERRKVAARGERCRRESGGIFTHAVAQGVEAREQGAQRTD